MLTTTTSFVQFQGNGTTTSLPFNFYVQQAGHLVVSVTDNTPESSSHYSAPVVTVRGNRGWKPGGRHCHLRDRESASFRDGSYYSTNRTPCTGNLPFQPERFLPPGGRGGPRLPHHGRPADTGSRRAAGVPPGADRTHGTAGAGRATGTSRSNGLNRGNRGYRRAGTCGSEHDGAPGAVRSSRPRRRRQLERLL